MLGASSQSNRAFSRSIILALLYHLNPTVTQSVELFRCTVDGHVEFRQTACTDGEQSKTEVVEQNRGLTPIEPSLRYKESEPKPLRKSINQIKPQMSEERCWKTRTKLEQVERRLRSGYKPSQSQNLHAKQQEYEEFLRLFCRP